MKKPIRRIVLIIASILLLAFLVVYYVALDPFLEHLVERRLNSYINNTPERLYDIGYGTLDISVSDRAVRIGKLNIEPRKMAKDSMINNHLSMLMSVKIDSFYFDGLKLFKLLVLDKLEFDEIVADRPEVKYYFNPKAKAPPEEGKVAANVFSDKLKHALLHHFKVENGNYFAIQLPLADSIYFEMDSSTVIVDEISIEPSQKDPFKMVYFDSLHFVSGKFYGGFVKHYRIDARSIEFSTKHEWLKIDSLAFVPKHFDMADTSVQSDHDIFIVQIDAIGFLGLDLANDPENDDYYVRKIRISRPDVTVSVDKRLPKNMNRKPLFAELIRNIPVPFGIDTLMVSGGKILYHEVTSGDKPPLNVLFTRVGLTGNNITNNPELLSGNPKMEMAVNSKFLDAGNLKLNVKVPIQSPDNKMIVQGELGSMTFEPVNDMLEGPMQVRFIAGKINSLDFQFVADTVHSTGNLNFDYSNMKIQIFKADESSAGNKKEKSKWLLNAIVNGVVKTNNNKTDINFATGLIKYERPPDIGIPGYLYRSLKAGLLSTLKPGKRHGDEAIERKKEQTAQKNEEKKEQRQEKAVQKEKQNEEKKEQRKKDKKKKGKKSNVQEDSGR